ncbi:MAG: type II/IV secretion system protein [Candidatus Omnitrophica bacterium]|nr:type II/IV secretion system protein [Candidatus Omnitrophota bacterium]
MAKIGEILIQKGLLSSEQFDEALKESKKTGQVIGKVLLSLELVTQEQLLEVLGEQLGIPFYRSLKDMNISQDVIDAVPVKFVSHYKIMPLIKQGTKITIAVSEPMAIWFIEDLRLHLGYDIERILATEEEILAAMRKYYGLGAKTVEDILAKSPAEKKTQVEEIEDVGKTAEASSVITLVNQILSEAISARATDIHIEPYREKVRVRYRIDGMLYDMNVSEQIRHLHQAIVSRIKILSNLNVVEKRLPQDGRFIVKIQNNQVDLRISIIPSIAGEGVVIRVLPVRFLLNLETLGFFPHDLKELEIIMKKPHGIIFLTGPTGSGKTTTLYSCLNIINKDKVKIITIEDPVEYELNGVMQIQINPRIGFTFSQALRSILRHDPDIMMVGEVRDLETAELAIRTALTGHLIFSTLHTNDAASGAARLMDVGIQPYLVTSSVNAFIAQRLVRMICPACKEKRNDKDNLADVFKSMDVYYGRGCPECNNLGYRGRTVIYEIYPMTPEIQELVLAKASAACIKQKARELGFKSLKDIGLEKVKMGLTTPEELMQVVELKD